LEDEIGTFTLPTSVRIVEVERSFATPEMQTSVGAEFGQEVRLLGYDLQRTDQDVRLTLHWQALSEMATDYKLFVHLFDPATEAILSQLDVLVGADEYPTTRWIPNEVVGSQANLSLGEVPKGRYRLAVGLYHADRRLPVAAPTDFIVSTNRLLLPTIIQVP
jgi:hypothetical protein